jgi:FMN reductase
MTGELSWVVVIGHPRPCSRTHAVAARAGQLLHEMLVAGGLPLAAPEQIDLAELAPCLLDYRAARGAASTALTAVGQAPLVLMASPTFRGACSGLLKLFLDLLPRNGLESTVAVPLMTAGLEEHRFAVDTSLRPVLLELRAAVPAGGICVLETELARFDDVFAAWWARHGADVRHVVSAQVSRQDEVAPC